MTEAKRFYVGNLVADISEADLRSLFDRFGSVSSVDIKNKRDIDGNVTATFAFVKLDELSDNDVTNVIKQCNHLKWKKQIIRVQLAQESFMDRLQKEREGNQKIQANNAPVQIQNFQQPSDRSTQSSDVYDPLALVKHRVVRFDSEKTSLPTVTTRRKYYSSSDEDEAPIEPRRLGADVDGDKFLSKLESFNSDFWNDCESKRPSTSNTNYLKSDRENLGNRNNKTNHDDSNAKRLASMKERQNQIQTQKRSIMSGLSNSNVESKSKVVKLGSDDEDEGGNDGNSGKAKKLLLEDSSDEEENDVKDRFRIRPQFEGKTGEKLLSLQSKFANDDRFKIDERFKQKEKKKRDKNILDSLDEETKEERLRNLKILSSIIGSEKKIESPMTDEKKLFKDPSKMRFDPSNKDHQQFLVKVKERESSSDEDELPEKVVESKSIPKILEEMAAEKDDKNYWVSNSLSQALAGTKRPASSTEASTVTEKPSFTFGFVGKVSSNGDKFSFLSKFGKSGNEEVDISKRASSTKHLSFLENNPFKYESSDTEDEEGKDKTSNGGLMVLDPMELFAQKLKEKASATKGVSESFFFRSNDPRLEEGRFFFTPTQSMDEMRSKHEVQRPLLAQIMKKKLRRRAKKQEKLSFDLKSVNRRGGIMKKKFGRGNFNNRK